MGEVTLRMNAKRKEVKDRPLGQSNVQKKGKEEELAKEPPR